MRFFVDSANPQEIRDGVARGLIAGACAPVTVGDRDGMLREARVLARLAIDVGAELAVRLPCSEDGLAVARACAAEGIGTEVAGCATPAAALRAAQAGARYVSPPTEPTGPGAEAQDLVRKLVATLRSYDLSTEVLVAARSASQVVDAAVAGARGVTGPYDVLVQLSRQRSGDANSPAR